MTIQDSNAPAILCFGAMHMDKLAHCHRPFMAGVSNPVSSELAVGGVGFNIARNLRLRHCDVGMVSCLGMDPNGSFVLDQAKDWQIDTSLVHQTDGAVTATYTAILNNDGELAAGLSEMDIYEEMTVSRLAPELSDYHKWPYWVIDANLPAETILWLCENKGESKVFTAPVSVVKAERWKRAIPYTDFWIGNGTEATVLSGILVHDIETAQAAADKLRNFGPKVVVVTLAADGLVLSSEAVSGHWKIPPTKVVDVNGAGDSFFAGFTSEITKCHDVTEAVLTGLAVASLTAETSGPVQKDLSDEILAARRSAIPAPKLK